MALTEEKVAAFVELMRENVANGDVAFRRAYLRSVINRVEVDEREVRMVGRNAAVEKLVTETRSAPSSVPSLVGEWRARRDSNS